MSTGHRNEIRVLAPELPPAIEQALSMAIITGPGQADAPFLLGFEAEAADLARLVENAFLSMTSLLVEHDAEPRACMVNGLHGTDTGHRIWGMLECSVARSTVDIPSTRVDDVRVSQTTEGHWEVAFRVTQGFEDDLLGHRGGD